MRIFPTVALAALAVAGCNDTSAPAPAPSTDAAAVPEPAPATPPPRASPAPTSADTPAATQIPAAVQGRWGLVANDCDPARDDAKGLLTVGPDTLRFYESRATLGPIKEVDATRIRATFAFTGEGMTWTRDIVLDAQDGGKTLIRREYGADAAPSPLRYMRCPGPPMGDER
jgi:hypothetical protein